MSGVMQATVNTNFNFICNMYQFNSLICRFNCSGKFTCHNLLTLFFLCWCSVGENWPDSLPHIFINHAAFHLVTHFPFSN